MDQDYKIQIMKSGRLFLIEESRRNYSSDSEHADDVRVEVKWLEQAPDSEGRYKRPLGQVTVNRSSRYGAEEQTTDINWSAQGAQNIEHAEGYAATLALAISIAYELEDHPANSIEFMDDMEPQQVLYDSRKSKR